MASSLFIVILLIQFTGILTAVPKFTLKCSNLLDPECLRSVAQEALPIFASGNAELGTETLDVIYIDPKEFSIIGLNLFVTEAFISGLQNADIIHISLDLEKLTLKIIYETDLGLKCTYKASGNLLNLPISGDGNMTIDYKNLYVEMLIPFDIIKTKGGKEYLELKGFQFNYEIRGGVSFELTNLFNGDQELSVGIRTYVNDDSWRAIAVQFSRPVLEEVHIRIFNVIKTFLELLPIQDFVKN